MNRTGFSNTLAIVLIMVVIGGVVGYFIFLQQQKFTPDITTPQISDYNNTQPTVDSTLSEIPLLSADKKSIATDDKIMIAIDDDEIFNFFKTKSQLCDVSNIGSTPDRKIFCENKATFKNKTRFASIVSSPDNTKIGFTVESDALFPDKVVGIFYPSRKTNRVYFLTNYYLGNEFISFSPNGAYFVYRGNCWEAMCGLFIKNSETLADKIDFNNPREGLDARNQNSEFVRWLSDGEVEYKLGAELKMASF